MTADVLAPAKETRKRGLFQPHESYESRPGFKAFPKTWVAFRKIVGANIIIRTIRPDDEPLMVEFHKTLSDYSVQFRYFDAVSLRERTLHERLRRHCSVDCTRELALVAILDKSHERQILGVGRLFKNPSRNDAEFALLIADPWQGKGLGTELLKLLVRLGRRSRLDRIVGHILDRNTAMRRASERAGFKLHFNGAIGEWLAVITF
jgi:acetyltransferase